MKKEKIGDVVVDSGTVVVGDPCYFVGNDTTTDDVNELGVVVEMTNGDGLYPVYLETDLDGRRRLVVNLD